MTENVFDSHHRRVLAPSALNPFSYSIAFFHNLGSAQIVEKSNRIRKKSIEQRSCAKSSGENMDTMGV